MPMKNALLETLLKEILKKQFPDEEFTGIRADAIIEIQSKLDDVLTYLIVLAGKSTLNSEKKWIRVEDVKLAITALGIRTGL